MHQEREIGDHFLAILVAGFSALVLLTGLAGYIAFGVMYPAEAKAERRASEELAAAQIIESLHHDEDSLNTIFYALASGGAEADRQSLRKRLDLVASELDSRIASASAFSRSSYWERVRTASAAFVVEGRQVLDSTKTPPPAFYRKHGELTEAVGQAATAIFTSARDAERQEAERSARRIRIAGILLAAALLLAIAVTVFAIYLTRRTMIRVRWQASELGLLSSRAMSDLDALARRFSRELHDQFGQTLTAMEANLVAIRNRGAYDEGRIEDCLGLIQDGISSVREVSQLLRPSTLDDFGLDASLRWLSETFSERTGIRVEYTSTFNDRLDTETETQVFRIAQEALTNIGRHSGATEALVKLTREDDRVRLSVADNGRGFDPRATEHGLGLVGMRARARTARGVLMIVPGRGRGMTVLLEVPFQPQEKA